MSMKTLLIVLFAIFIVSCGPPEPKVIGDLSKIVNYESGVYRFPTGNFPQTLSAFLKINSNLEITAITNDGTGMYGSTLYYIVTFKQKESK